MEVDDRTLLRIEYKTTPKWVWPRSRDPDSKFGTPAITFEQKELSAANFGQTYRSEPPCVGTIKRPLSGRGQRDVT